MKILPFALLTLLTALFACETPQEKQPEAQTPAAPTEAEMVQRGQYLVEIMGCGDCHTPKIMTDKGPAPDPKRLLSGHPADEKLPPFPDPKKAYSGEWALFSPGLTAGVGPWGINYSANLTPDETGLGNWTFENFKKALTEGKSKGQDGGRMLMPPMPWQNYVNMKDEDLRAMFSYLKSIPPVKNIPPTLTPPPPM